MKEGQNAPSAIMKWHAKHVGAIGLSADNLLGDIGVLIGSRRSVTSAHIRDTPLPGLDQRQHPLLVRENTVNVDADREPARGSVISTHEPTAVGAARTSSRTQQNCGGV